VNCCVNVKLCGDLYRVKALQGNRNTKTRPYRYSFLLLIIIIISAYRTRAAFCALMNAL
jgi:hypothetical protein